MKGSSTLAQLFTRAALGLGFLLPVLDRTGLLGANGTSGVTWGDWSHFITYTHRLMPFTSAAVAEAAGLMATIAEGILAVGLIVGFKLKWMALGAALITFIFGFCMIMSLGISAPFNYPVFVFTASALLLYGQNNFKWSLDQVLNKKK